MARPTKLTSDVQKNIIQALEAGNYFDAACEYAGITATTGYNWMSRGRDELERRKNANVKEGTKQWTTEQPFVEFFEAVSRTSAKVEIGVIAQIRTLGKDDWRALAWFMEHRYPTKWGKQYSEGKTELTGKDGGAIATQNTNVNIEAKSPHDAGTILRQLAELGAIPPNTIQSNNNTETE